MTFFYFSEFYAFFQYFSAVLRKLRQRIGCENPAEKADWRVTPRSVSRRRVITLLALCSVAPLETLTAS
jgi:hypothetical protein